jgi:hypothetical protein
MPDSSIASFTLELDVYEDGSERTLSVRRSNGDDMAAYELTDAQVERFTVAIAEVMRPAAST